MNNCMNARTVCNPIILYQKRASRSGNHPKQHVWWTEVSGGEPGVRFSPAAIISPAQPQIIFSRSSNLFLTSSSLVLLLLLTFSLSFCSGLFLMLLFRSIFSWQMPSIVLRPGERDRERGIKSCIGKECVRLVMWENNNNNNFKNKSFKELRKVLRFTAFNKKTLYGQIIL